jgi:hypothetical protein
MVSSDTQSSHSSVPLLPHLLPHSRAFGHSKSAVFNGRHRCFPCASARANHLTTNEKMSTRDYSWIRMNIVSRKLINQTSKVHNYPRQPRFSTSCGHNRVSCKLPFTHE